MTRAWPLALMCVLVGGTDAASFDARTVKELLAAPARYDGAEVMVEGVIEEVRLSEITVYGNPTRQMWLPMFLLRDDQVGLWVVVIGGASTAPPVGTAVRVRGTYRGATRAIDTYYPLTVR